MPLTRFVQRLAELKNENLYRTITDRESAQGRVISLNGKTLINFSSNDYLGLSYNPEIIEHTKKYLQKFGTGGGSSRLLHGGTLIHAELETLTAQFKQTESALTFPSGYSANVSAIPALADTNTAIFSDELNHASIIDGVRLSNAAKYIYRHNDVEHLSELMVADTNPNKMVVTESVFSMDGDIAPIDSINELCKAHNALLYIDDAHGTGVIGNGVGALHHFCIKPEPHIIQMGTYSKAFGSLGGFIAASKVITDYLINTARGFIFSTALPSYVAAASVAAIKFVMKNPEIVNRLTENTKLLKNSLKDIGIAVNPSDTAIVPVYMSSVKETLKVSEFLQQKGFRVPAIRPKTVKTPRLRISVSALHTKDDLMSLVAALKEAL
ncbi:MAG: 8-amino-7-oxononanoate synthase [Nitrospirae bacterium]|nr:8-amino-7-oxononanoate synthase [Nitrospirota bacterium]MBF0534855.1 8-amino-7-oxononanoate synthase [Nitrospirota bacterium]MBF0616770.1 8-amino-7-oxononanoate synthase [Nitrospirota bacterium]